MTSGSRDEGPRLAPGTPIEPDPGDRPRVLLIGEHGVSPALEEALRARPVKVEATSAQGVAALRDVDGLALVLVDLSDPEQAAQVTRELASQNGWRAPLLVSVPAEDDRAFALAFEAGASDVVARPLRVGFVARRLAHLARRAPRADRNSDEGARRGPMNSAAAQSAQLADRRQLADDLARACAQARSDESTVALLHIELERYRELVHGLPTGSAAAILSSVAARLRKTTRATDTIVGTPQRSATIARVGGGEYCVMLQGLARSEDAAKAARRIVDALADPLELQGLTSQPLVLEANVGIACYPGENRNPEELVDFARMATASARQDGPGNVRFYAPSMNVRAFERLSLESGMRRALEQDQFVVYYQPRIEIASGQIIGLEALVRWKHPELGMIAPGQFIPLAEETGLIVPIGEKVLRTACAQGRDWQRRGLPPVSISVNLSSVQFQQPELYDTVVRVLGESGLDPSWLELELTESLLMQNVESVVSTLKRFRDAGIRLSIDDFGTGYSSLAYLKRFPIDALKIDRSFVREVTTNADDAALATSIILMGRSLKLKVVAEGVETASQLSFLRIMQCDEAQGFLYSPPVPAVDAERLLREGCHPLAA